MPCCYKYYRGAAASDLYAIANISWCCRFLINLFLLIRGMVQRTRIFVATLDYSKKILNLITG